MLLKHSCSFYKKYITSNSMVSREIWEKHTLMSFSKTHKLHSSFGLEQFCTFLKNSLVHACFSQIALKTILLPILIPSRHDSVHRTEIMIIGNISNCKHIVLSMQHDQLYYLQSRYLCLGPF